MKAKSVEVQERGFDKGFPPVIADHRFFCTADGQLGHEIDGRHRATIPPQSFAAYAAEWPACKPVIAALKGPAKKKK